MNLYLATKPLDISLFIIITRMMLGKSQLVSPEALADRLMLAELQTVSQVLGCDYIFDKEATKQKFLEVAVEATVLHIGKCL